MAIVEGKWMPHINGMLAPVRNGCEEGVSVCLAAPDSFQLRQHHVNAILAAAPCLLHNLARKGSISLQSLTGEPIMTPVACKKASSQARAVRNHCALDVLGVKHACRRLLFRAGAPPSKHSSSSAIPRQSDMSEWQHLCKVLSPECTSRS